MSFPLPPLRKDRKDSDYEIGELLGRGNFVTVYSAVEIDTGRPCALKVVDRYRCDKLKKTNDLYMERHCLRRVNHPNIIKMFAWFSDTLTVFVDMEECVNGELWDMVKTVGCPDHTARHYFSQLLDALEYLRQANIVHRDLKCENIMIAARDVIKLIDFGTAKDLENPHLKGSGNQNRSKVFEHYVGTPQFMAPEIIENKSSDFRSDTWATGCVLYQILLGIPPFHAASEYLVFCKIQDMNLKFPPGVHPLAKDLIQQMVVKDKDSRLGATDLSEVRRHGYLKECTFGKAFERPAPVRSLADWCMYKVGKSWKQMQGEVQTWPRKKELVQSLQDILERISIVATWQDEATPPEDSFD